jgi:hypothetical protein
MKERGLLDAVADETGSKSSIRKRLPMTFVATKLHAFCDRPRDEKLKVFGEPIWSEISAADIRRVFGSLVDRLRN